MIYAVSDIHGDLAMYNHIVKQLNKDDTLYVIGDAMDRGSSGIMILKDIMKRPNVEFLLGNHEWFLIMSMFYGCESIMNIWISKQNGGTKITYSRNEWHEEYGEYDSNIVLQYTEFKGR